jgi:hypothetical protein
VPIQVQCPACRRDLSAPREMLGKVILCTVCGSSVPVTGPAPIRQTSPAAPPPPPAAPAAPRMARPAQFIAGDPQARQIALGKDGQLPELVLQSVDAVSPVEKRRTAHPLLLASLVVASFLLSAGMLLYQPGSTTERLDDSQTRRELARDYHGDKPPFAPYQQLLRQAEQAYNQGDYDRERACYRQVLNLLHAERENRSFGLTGFQTSAPPNDRRLEELLSSLLRDD